MMGNINLTGEDKINVAEGKAPKPKPMIDQQQPKVKLDPDDPKAKAPTTKLTNLFK